MGTLQEDGDNVGSDKAMNDKGLQSPMNPTFWGFFRSSSKKRLKKGARHLTNGWHDIKEGLPEVFPSGDEFNQILERFYKIGEPYKDIGAIDSEARQGLLILLARYYS